MAALKQFRSYFGTMELQDKTTDRFPTRRIHWQRYWRTLLKIKSCWMNWIREQVKAWLRHHLQPTYEEIFRVSLKWRLKLHWDIFKHMHSNWLKSVVHLWPCGFWPMEKKPDMLVRPESHAPFQPTRKPTYSLFIFFRTAPITLSFILLCMDQQVINPILIRLLENLMKVNNFVGFHWKHLELSEFKTTLDCHWCHFWEADPLFLRKLREAHKWTLPCCCWYSIFSFLWSLDIAKLQAEMLEGKSCTSIEDYSHCEWKRTSCWQ